MIPGRVPLAVIVDESGESTGAASPANAFAKPKIQDLYISSRRYFDIGRLEITMHHAFFAYSRASGIFFAIWSASPVGTGPRTVLSARVSPGISSITKNVRPPNSSRP